MLPFNSLTIKAQAPHRSGIYVLYDALRAVTYVGSSKDLQRRLLEHANGSAGPCTAHASYFVFEETPFERLREQQLLEDYRRRHGRLPRCNDVAA